MGQLVEELILKSDNYNRNINSAINKLEDLKSRSGKAGQGINSLSGGFKGLGNMAGFAVGGLTKLAGVLGIAMGAGEMFNQMLRQSQTLGDGFAKVQLQASSAIGYFASAIANVNFSNFINQMKDVIELAGKSADLSDNYATLSLQYGFASDADIKKYNRLLKIARDRTKSEQERNKALKEADALNKKMLADDRKMAQEARKDARGKLNTALAQQGIPKEALKLFSTDYLAELSKGAFSGHAGARMAHINTESFWKKNEHDKKDWAQLAENLRGKVPSRFNIFADSDERKFWEGAAKAAEENLAKYEGMEETLKKRAKKGDKEAAQLLVVKALKNIDDAKDGEFAGVLDQLKEADNILHKVDERESQAATVDARLNGAYGESAKNVSVSSPKEEVFEAGSTAEITSRINKLREAIDKTADAKERLAKRGELRKAEEELKNLEISDNMAEALAKFEDFGKLELPVKIEPKLPDISSFQEKAKEVAESLTPSGKMQSYSAITEQIRDAYDMADIGALSDEQAQNIIDRLNERLQALGLKPLEINIKKEKALNEIQGFGNSVSALGEAFSNFGDAFDSPDLNVAGIVSGAIANIISGYASASTQAATLGPWAWIAFTLSGLAQIGSVVSQIHSLSGYANGGIVGGDSYHGDRNLIRVNSGEMILNKGQQAGLFHLLDRGGAGVAGGGGTVQFKVQGKDLVGVLSNYNNRNSKLY